jgi:ATP-dependent RNA helicase DeaD
VVGTPGRLIDHLTRKTLRLQNVNVVVLDEADIMLDMGFIDDITTLLKETPADRQTLLFSATLSEPILQIGRKYMRNPHEIRISKKNVTVESVSQVYYETTGHHRFDALCRILDVYQPVLTLIFCETKHNVDTLTARLVRAGRPAEAIHGDLSQAQRDKVMKKFRDGTVKILVATDVAARGLNISAVSHVINYNLPKNAETYIHRIGRTGRAGMEGVAITLISPYEYRDLKTIQAQSKARMEKKELPTDREAQTARFKGIREQIESAIKKDAVQKYSPWLKELYSGLTPEAVASALLYLIDHVEPAEEAEREETKRHRTGYRGRSREGDLRGDYDRKSRRYHSENRERPYAGGYRARKEALRGKEVDMMPVMTRARRTKE